MEYRQTWKRMATRSGRLYWAHTASAHRTSDNGSTGWPTPNARDHKDSPGMATTGTNPDGSTRNRLDMLPRVAHLCGWPSPTCKDTGVSETARDGGENLSVAAQLSGWPTPAANEFEGSSAEKMNERREREKAKGKNGNGFGMTLGMLCSGWATPSAAGSAGEISEDLERVGNKWRNKKTGRILQTNLATDVKMLVGTAPPSSLAETGKPADAQLPRRVLNPFFTAWLMGFPVIWTIAGLSSMRLPVSRSRKASGEGQPS